MRALCMLWLWGIRRGLVVTMHGFAWVFQVWVSAGSPNGLAWLPYKCAALLRAEYSPSVTERPLGTIHEENGVPSRFWFSISSPYDLSSWRWRKHSFRPSFFLLLFSFLVDPRAAFFMIVFSNEAFWKLEWINECSKAI